MHFGVIKVRPDIRAHEQYPNFSSSGNQRTDLIDGSACRYVSASDFACSSDFATVIGQPLATFKSIGVFRVQWIWYLGYRFPSHKKNWPTSPDIISTLQTSPPSATPPPAGAAYFLERIGDVVPVDDVRRIQVLRLPRHGAQRGQELSQSCIHRPQRGALQRCHPTGPQQQAWPPAGPRDALRGRRIR